MKVLISQYIAFVILLLGFTSRLIAQTEGIVEQYKDSSFTSLAEALKNPDAVKSLSLRRSHLKSFPPEIFLFSNIVELDLSKNKLEVLPGNLSQLSHLQKLNVSKNKLTSLPADIGNINTLTEIKAFDNFIVAIPPTFGKLNNLQILDLWGNEISEFPEQLGQLKNTLKVLDLRAILMNDKTQAHIRSLLPNTTIHFSRGCNCK